MASDCRFEDLFRFRKALDVIDVGMRGDQRYALGERKVELSNQLNAIVDGVFEADVDQRPFVLVVNQVNAARYAPPRLVI